MVATNAIDMLASQKSYASPCCFGGRVPIRVMLVGTRTGRAGGAWSQRQTRCLIREKADAPKRPRRVTTRLSGYDARHRPRLDPVPDMAPVLCFFHIGKHRDGL